MHRDSPATAGATLNTEELFVFLANCISYTRKCWWEEGLKYLKSDTGLHLSSQWVISPRHYSVAEGIGVQMGFWATGQATAWSAKLTSLLSPRNLSCFPTSPRTLPLLPPLTSVPKPPTGGCLVWSCMHPHQAASSWAFFQFNHKFGWLSKELLAACN